MLYEPLTYPVFVIKKFDFITYSGADEFEVGQVFMYDPTNIVHQAWNEARCFAPIPNKDCKYQILQMLNNDEISIGDIVEFDSLPESRIDDFVLAGFVKKIYKPAKSKIKQPQKAKNKSKKQVKLSFSDISKKAGLKPKVFKQKYLEIFGKEILNMKHRVSKPTEKKILEALSI